MYAKFFGLGQDPFSIAPDPRYLFMSERHREALAHLLYGLGGGGGFVLLSGEIGTGKTTVCRCFLEQIPVNCNVAYIFNPKLSATELLHSICDEFHLALPADASSARDFIDPLNDFLLRTHAAGQNNVLIIDEAQNLSADVLEQLRLLTNLETNERKLLQIVLIGQPELRRMLARPQLEQLAQRVIARFHLDALSSTETAQYIAHRLSVAGLSGASPFDAKAVARIHKLSRGVPRRINLLCGRAMLGAYASGQAQVDRRTVDKAALEVFGPPMKTTRSTDQPALATATATDTAGKTVPGRNAWWPAGTVTIAAGVGLLAGAALLAGALWGLNGRSNLLPQQPWPAGAKAGAAAVAALPASAASGATQPGTAAQNTATAAMPAASAPVAAVSSADIVQALRDGPGSQNQAWQSLARAWGMTLTGPDACAEALKQQVHCFASRQTPLSLIRELDRPGIVTLFIDDRRLGYAVLERLNAQSANLRIGNTTFTVSLPVLAELWRGDFATLRRAPAGLSDLPLAGNRATLEWLAGELARVPGAAPLPGGSPAAMSRETLETALRSRISAFQLAHGLTADGQAGPMTLMQLNRATGVDEPRLTATPR